MNLDDCIIAWFCLIDDLLPVVLHGQRLRQRGPHPNLSDSEMLAMELVGTYLGLISADSSLRTTQFLSNLMGAVQYLISGEPAQ